MEHTNKRLKSSSGQPIKITNTGNAGTGGAAAKLPAYRPPTAAVINKGGSSSSASIARPANGKTSLRLTVKAPPSKLRQATSGSQIAAIPPNPYADAGSDSEETPAPRRGARSTRNPRTVVEAESDEDDEVEEDEEEEVGGVGDEEGEDEEMEDEIAVNQDSEEEEGEGEEEEEEEEEEEDDEEEDEEDDDMDDELQATHPPPPIIKQHPPPPGQNRPNVTVTAPPEGPLKSVEDKEMDDLDSDEEQDSLEDAEGEEDDLSSLISDSEGHDARGGSTDISRSATPDLSKLTRRQRGAYDETDASGLLSLSNEAQKKKHLTAEEHAMRRAEMARRRKNLSEKRNEEEKMDTINKLLKKPAPKRRTRAEIIAQQQREEAMGTPGATEEGAEEEIRPADPLYVRWVHSAEGSRIGVPEEWLDAPVGELFARDGVGGAGLGARMVVEEIA